MRIDLSDLLRHRRIVHPTRVAGVELRHGCLRIVVAGHRWWADPATEQEGRITLSFDGINVGLLDLELLLNRSWDETLEHFDVRALGAQPWADVGAMHSTYCRAPLPEPLALHAIVHDLLLTARAPYRAAHYLNGGETLAGFRRLTASSDYLLSTAPAAVHALIAAELTRQRVACTVLTQVRAASTQLFVTLGDGSFICEEAWAEWEG